MTPQNLLSQSQPSQTSPESPEGQALFSQPNSQSDSQSASKQLISEVASIHSSLKGLATAHPEMTEEIDAAMQMLTKGMDKAISTMQGENRGNQPAYA